MFKIDFNFKTVMTDLTKYDSQKIYDYVHHLEKNEFLKKNKMMRKMHEKVHFYQKLELDKYQKAYQKISTNLKETEVFGKRGELSYLNDNSMVVNNTMNMSKNKSILQKNQNSLNESINQDTSQMNFLDGLDSHIMNTSVIQRQQSILDIIQNLKDKFKTDKFNDLNFISVEMFFKHVKEFISHLEESIVTLNIDPTNRNKHNDLNENRALQNYQFYKFCLDEFKEKSKLCDNRIQIITLLLKNRNIQLEEKESEKFYKIISTNKILLKEDNLNFKEDLDKIELLKLIEQSYLKKKNILSDRRNFISIIDEKVNSIKIDLSQILTNLNRYEDKYMYNLAKYKDIQISIDANTSQIREYMNENKNLKKIISEQEQEVKNLQHEIDNKRISKEKFQNKISEQELEKNNLQKEIKQNEAQIEFLNKLTIENEIYLFEMKETNTFLKSILEKENHKNDKLTNEIEAEKLQLAQSLSKENLKK